MTQGDLFKCEYWISVICKFKHQRNQEFEFKTYALAKTEAEEILLFDTAKEIAYINICEKINGKPIIKEIVRHENKNLRIL